MLARTHIVFGFLLGVFLMPFVKENPYVYFPLILIFSIFPDIDSPHSIISKRLGYGSSLARLFTRHRGIWHSIWALALIAGVPWFFLGSAVGIPIALGYFSHLLIDGMTKMGVNFLHPFANLRLQGFIEVGSILELVVFATLIVITVFTLFPLF